MGFLWPPVEGRGLAEWVVEEQTATSQFVAPFSSWHRPSWAEVVTN